MPGPIVDPLNTTLTPVVEAGDDRNPDQVGVTTSAQLIPRDHTKPLLRAMANKSPGGATGPREKRALRRDARRADQSLTKHSPLTSPHNKLDESKSPPRQALRKIRDAH